MDAVRCFVSSQNSWDKFLQQLAGALRACVNRQTGFTANKLMLGRETNKSVDLLYPDPIRIQKYDSSEQNVADLQRSIEYAHKVAREKLGATQKVMKRDYNTKILVKTFQVGDAVHILNTATVKGKSSKLKAPWKGPGIIVEKFSNALFRILVKEKDFVVNHARIKLCTDRSLPQWIKRLKNDPKLIESLLEQKRNCGSAEQRYCLCRQPDNGEFMIQCDFCLEW